MSTNPTTEPSVAGGSVDARPTPQVEISDAGLPPRRHDGNRGVRWRLFGIAGLALLGAAGVVVWILNAGVVDHWLWVYVGDKGSGPYYGFWSGFGSDIAEFGILGAIGTGIYQLGKRWNCHEPGCWRVGTHPAAGGKFLLCYRHHPDYAGKKPTHEMIERLHREHSEREAAIHDKVFEIKERRGTPHTNDGDLPGAPDALAS